MRYLIAAAFVCCSWSYAHAQLDDLIAEVTVGGGLVALRNDGDLFSTHVIEFLSTNEGLIPAPGGDLTTNVEPFDFALANTTGNVVFGNLGTFTEFPAGSCTVLTVGVQPNADVTFLVAYEPVGASENRVDRVEVTCVPEPTAEALACFGFLALTRLVRTRVEIHPFLSLTRSP